MKICPACGADILDSATLRCSSCGTDMDKESPRIGETYEAGAPDAGPVKETLDDTSPIKPSADLELVTRGNAFWTEDREETPKPAPKEEVSEATKPDVDREARAPKKSKATEVQTALFQRENPEGHAPSLAELASKRREELGETTYKRPDSARTSPDWPENTKFSERGPDDTDPDGLVTCKEGPARPAAPPEPGVSVVSRSLDTAFIEGQSLFIPGATWASGEHLVVQGKTYQLKRKVSKYPISPRMAAFAGGGLVMGCLLTWMMLSGNDVPTGNIFGLVREAGTGRLLPGVTVAIEDAGQMVQSDPTGMFAFERLREGIYTLIATDPIYGKRRMPVTVSSGTAAIMLDLEKPATAMAEPPKPAPVKPKPTPTSATQQDPVQEVPADTRGTLAVTASVANSKIYLDGKMLGVGNAVYAGIRPGERTVRVEHEGFQPWVKTVTIKGGETHRLEPQLLAEQAAAPVQLTPEQYAAAGRKALEKRQYADAAEQLSLAIKGAQRAQFYAWRADAYVGMKKLQAAESDYLAAMELFKQAGETSKLDAMLERAVLVVPASAPLRMAYGDYLYSQRKLQDAVKSYRKALEMGADPARTYIAIGLAQYAGGSYDEANTSWTRADEASGGTDPNVAGYLALSNARLQYRASCRNAVRRLRDYPDLLQHFRSHPDWEKVQRVAGEG